MTDGTITLLPPVTVDPAHILRKAAIDTNNGAGTTAMMVIYRLPDGKYRYDTTGFGPGDWLAIAEILKSHARSLLPITVTPIATR